MLSENPEITSVSENNLPKPITDILEEGITEESAPKEIEHTEQMYLQLGDIINISSTIPDLNGHNFYINYISQNKIIAIDYENLNKVEWAMNNGMIENEDITEIKIIHREISPSYAIQRGLIPGKWIKIILQDLTSIDGEIENLEEDGIAVKLYPDDDTIYIDFEYQGLPDEIKEIIFIENPIALEVEQEEPSIQDKILEQMEEEQAEAQAQEQAPRQRTPIVYEDEQLEPIQQNVEINKSFLRYSIEEQTNDLLDSLLSKVATENRTTSVLNSFSKIITRFKQLRTSFSIFDKYNNVIARPGTKSFIVHGANWKPITKSLFDLNNKLFWILLVGKNNLNSCDPSETNLEDYARLANFIDNYNKTTHTDLLLEDQNRYINLMKQISNELTPFNINEVDCMYKHEVARDMNIFQIYQNTFLTKNGTNISYLTYPTTRYNTELSYITHVKQVKKLITQRIPITKPDTLCLSSIISLPEPAMHFSKINLPGTNMLDRSNLGQTFLYYWKFLNKYTKLNNMNVKNIDDPVNYANQDFIQNINHYNLELTNEEQTKDENYMQYLNNIIPTTKELFNLIKPNITGMSFVKILEHLEPFLIYSEDITYQQYKEFFVFIKNSFVNYAKQLETRKKEMSKLQMLATKQKEPTLFNLVKPPEHEEDIKIYNSYELLNIENYIKRSEIDKKEQVHYKLTNSELLQYIMNTDFGFLFTTKISDNYNIDHLFAESLVEFNIQQNKIYKNNNSQYNLGLLVQESNIIVSPYAKTLSNIMSVIQFDKKQELLLKFKNLYTRDPDVKNLDIMTGEFENVHWLYCNKTNVKLMPRFLYDLAFAYNNNTYETAMVEVIQRCGALSANNDSWVDMYSGYTIKPIDFNTEEEYTEEGFQIKSRAILQPDESEMRPVFKAVNKYVSNESKIIINIVTTLSKNMKINIEDQHDFIVSKAKMYYDKIRPTKETFEKRNEELIKNKKPPIEETFEEYNNKILLFITLSCFLIVVQTSIPSIKPDFSFPGCVASFNGYPFENSGDLSALIYLSCVLMKIKNPYNPWKLLPKKIEDTQKLIQAYIDNYLLNMSKTPDPDFIAKINIKKEYLIANAIAPDVDLSNEHRLWANFLPSLKPMISKISNNDIRQITDDFQGSLLIDFQRGDISQHDKMQIIESKIIIFSMAIQQLIFKIVSNEMYLLKSSVAPYVENTCCNGEKNITTLDYFTDKEPDIIAYNKNVMFLEYLLNNIDILTSAPLFLSVERTKIIPSVLSLEFNEETIYQAFIKYGNFKTLILNDEEITAISGEKPVINARQSTAEIIVQLKDSGRNYTSAQMLELLRIINKKNMVNVITEDAQTYTTEYSLLNILEKLDHLNIEEHLRQIVNAYLTINTEDKMETFEIFLFNDNVRLKDKMKKFITKNKGNDKTTNKNIELFKQSFNVQPNNELYNVDNAVNYIKNNIINVGIIFPSIIQNKVEYSINAHKYWNITDFHMKNIYNMSTKIFESINPYYNDAKLTNLLVTIQENVKYIISVSNQICTDGNNKNINMLFIEHLLLLVFLEYMNLSSDPNMIYNEERGDVDDENEEQDQAQNVIDSNTIMLQKKVASLLSDYLKIMGNSYESISISYDDVMDKVFVAKENEKNQMRSEFEIKTSEELVIDSIFRSNKIGKWAISNVTGYDGDRLETEYEIMMRGQQNLPFEDNNEEGATDDNILDLGDQDREEAENDERDF